MIQPSSQLQEVAVLRGGTVRREESLLEGVDILRSLTLRGYTPLDVIIDRDGTWTTKGVDTDAHYIFTRAHTVVDTTRDKGTPHKALAKKMGITLLLSHDDTVSMDRETMYRLLRQQGVKTPETRVVRKTETSDAKTLRTIWSTFHTPLLVRPLSRDHGHTSTLVRKYGDLEEVLETLHREEIDAHILTYTPKNVLSVAVLPSFRNQEIYIPLAVETFVDKNMLPRKQHPTRPVFKASEEKNALIQSIVEKAYRSLGLQGHALIDIVPEKESYMVVNVDTHPSLTREGRFMQSLATTGVDIGEYVHSRASL